MSTTQCRAVAAAAAWAPGTAVAPGQRCCALSTATAAAGAARRAAQASAAAAAARSAATAGTRWGAAPAVAGLTLVVPMFFKTGWRFLAAKWWLSFYGWIDEWGFEATKIVVQWSIMVINDCGFIWCLPSGNQTCQLESPYVFNVKNHL